MNRGTQREYISYAPTPMGYLGGEKRYPIWTVTPSEGLLIWELRDPLRDQEVSGTDS